MHLRSMTAATVSAGLLFAGVSVSAAPADAATYTTYKNCTAMHAKYKHGVGKKGAKDKVRGSTKPVTNFYVNNHLYAANRSLDRDGDGVACEAH